MVSHLSLEMSEETKSVNFEKIADGMPTGLGRLDLGDGDLIGLKLRGGFTISNFGLMHCLLSWSFDFFEVGIFTAAATPAVVSLSDGPVNL
ncbi:hypothetical protein SLE2022_288820 [Rubroshorea leprosula]